MDDSSDTEFEQDFGTHLTVADCNRLLERAHATGDADVRLLVKQYLALRRTATDTLAYIEERYGERVAASRPHKGGASYPLAFLRFLVDDPNRPT